MLFIFYSPREDVRPHRFIIIVHEVILLPVCQRGSLGCLAYNGGPVVKCDICDMDVLLPFVHYSPRKDIRSPKTPKAECPICYQKTFNVDEVLFLVC